MPGATKLAATAGTTKLELISVSSESSISLCVDETYLTPATRIRSKSDAFTLQPFLIVPATSGAPSSFSLRGSTDDSATERNGFLERPVQSPDDHASVTLEGVGSDKSAFFREHKPAELHTDFGDDRYDLFVMTPSNQTLPDVLMGEQIFLAPRDRALGDEYSFSCSRESASLERDASRLEAFSVCDMGYDFAPGFHARLRTHSRWLDHWPAILNALNTEVERWQRACDAASSETKDI